MNIKESEESYEYPKFVNFDDLVNEDNEISAPEYMKDMLDALVENNYAEDLFGTWWELGDTGEEEWFKENNIETKTMKEIVDEDPGATFGYSWGDPSMDMRLDVTNASGYIEDMGVSKEDYGVTSEDLGIEDDEWDPDEDYDDDEDYEDEE